MDTPVQSYISINKSDTVVKSDIVTNDEDQVDFETIEIKHEFGWYSDGDPVTFNNVKTEPFQPKTASKLRKVTPALCVLCNTGFPSTDLYEDHVIATHQSELPYQCNFCKKRFKTSTNRKRHETIHDESRFDGPAQFKCEFCEKSYHLKDSLESHRKIAHFGYKHNKKLKAGVVIQHHSKNGTRNPNANFYRKPKQIFECSKCTRVFPMKCELTNHMISHTESRSFQCQYCEAAFKHRSSLTGHIRRIHELGQIPKMSRPRNKAGEPCVCSECGKSYPVPNQLARHMLLHTGERPHECSICGLSFRNFRGLRLHRLKHFPPDETGLRTFLCRICGKSGIKRFMDLSGHLKKHSFDLSGDTEILKPYACGICGKPYYLAIKAVTCALLLHNPTGLREKMFKFKCSQCPEDFGYPCLASLRVHWESTHPGMEPPKQFRHPSYYKNITKDLPSVSYDKEKVLELRHGSGIPPEVESSPFPLYTALDLAPDLHLKKERKKIKQRPKQSKYAECDNCGVQMLRHNLSRHLQRCGKIKKGRKFEKKIVITDCKSIMCENVSSGSKSSNTQIVKASDSKAVRKILCNQLVSVQLTRLPFLYS